MSILNLKIRELDLNLPYKYQTQILKHREILKRYQIKWSPHYWLSDEWFSPNSIGGIAIPFMLSSSILIDLEKEYIGHCEGEKESDFLKLLCHETGHALDNAYQLRLLKERQKLFGLSGESYPCSYRPDPHNNDFVDFLGDHYAQAHPEEDWAETVGHLLYSNNKIQKRKSSHCIEKQIYTLKILNQLQHKSFKRTQKTYLNYKNDHRTIKQYLDDKKKNLNITKSYFSKEVESIFTHKTSHVKAFPFISKNKQILLGKQNVSHNWIVERFLTQLKNECKRNDYRLKYNESVSLLKIQQLIDTNLYSFIKKGGTRIYM